MQEYTGALENWLQVLVVILALLVVENDFPFEVMWAGKLPEHSLAPRIAARKEGAVLGWAGQGEVGLGEAGDGEEGRWGTTLYQPPPLLLVPTEGWFLLAERSVWVEFS